VSDGLATGQAPAHLWVPPFDMSHGDLAEQMGEWVGFDRDPGQRLFLDAVFAETGEGIPACFEVGVVAPRQNLKTAALQEAALTWLFTMGLELIVWTAHLYDTAQKAHASMKSRIERNPDLRSQCKWPPPSAHGNEAIELKTGERIEFHARSSGGGRGLTGDKVILDEAFALKAGEMGALLPTMATRRDAQVIYASSAGMLTSDVLRGVRDRGRKGGDPSLAWLEWCAPRVDCEDPACFHVVGWPGCALDRRDLWWAANPALSAGRITEDVLVKFRLAMPPGEFAREFLGWWDDPPNLGGAFDVEVWNALADRNVERGTEVAFGVAVAPDRSWAAIGAAWTRPDGLVHLSLSDYAPTTAWVPSRVADLKERYEGSTFAAPDDALDLAPGAAKLGLPDQRRAYIGFDDALTARSVRHDDDAALNTSVRGAAWRKTGESKVLDRFGVVEISPLVAVTFARWALGVDGPSIYEDRGLVSM